METKTNNLPKLITIVGPTASGKTAASLELAKHMDISVISADSRQVYKKMDIGTAKVEGEWKWKANWKGFRHSYFVEGVPHHLVDFLDPGKKFTVAQFRDKALKYIKMAYKNNRVPVVVGGTGLYIQALVENYTIPRIEENKKLRRSLEEKSNEELMKLLETMDPELVKTIDQKNKRRIIRALEVCILTGEPFSKQRKKGEPMFDVLQFGMDVDRAVLYDRINTRADYMIEQGLLEEIKALRKQKYAWELPSMSGIGYRQFKEVVDEGAPLEPAVEQLKKDTRNFAKRQMSWFRRDQSIRWITEPKEMIPFIQDFLPET